MTEGKKMRVLVCDDYAALSQRAAELVVELVKRKPNAVLGLPTGSTPIGFYDALVKSGVSLADVKTFNLDEYLGLPQLHSQSYYSFMKKHLFDRTDLKPENCHIPDGAATDAEAECERYEAEIKAAGGIDLILLGVGLNGHIGFNEPGSSWEGRTWVVELDESTRQANARFFDDISQVPTQAVTMGIGTIMEAREVFLLASGSGKAAIVKELVEGAQTVEVPATVLQTHGSVTVILDKDAASQLS